MKLSDGYGNGIRYKETIYNGRGAIIYNDLYRFQVSSYKVPQYNNDRSDYNLIFNI